MSLIPVYPEPRDLLKGKTVVITAAAGTGIGFAAAKRAAEEGAKLLISDFHERRLGEAADRIADEVGVERPATFVCDVTNEDNVQGLRDASLAALGKVDVLINNAGLGGEVDVVDMTDDQWSRVLDVTLTSLFRMTRAFLPTMYAAKSGAMVNNASVLGWRAQKGQSHYAAAKAGVMAFTRCSAIEAAEYGVRINAVSPSLAMHPFLAKVTTQEALDKLVEREAFGRPAEVWEIANVMMFLASDLASYMTGEIVSVSSQRA
ncbi:putative oxidoreductase [Caenibius tardaugens NBRC 16725]|uniref:Putative oxidoreductase n=1 Tax=Caenibius tardaugens NBRC 16725 TaxID=1219035 RepID=U2ZRB5_9SPHN|nr:SDR family oxidoreductase [Caenibius tardaugens]AZI36898.1 SDR family oxidoreductase [Caenibius tardaugens NBRC 16725]TXG93589.1 MAG: SDR family oxidoreductase [Rhodocyclaceae bacterium]GAD47899.1 putative oxidoreductase [Caenibius tardaugens NBRC 16725]